MEEKETEKPQEGAWDRIKGYPQKITFELDKPVLVTFDANFKEPKEMPNQDGKGVYYIFDVRDGQGNNVSITTSAWTLLNNLKPHEPLAGKSLIITKKNVNGKNMYYVNLPDAYNAPITEETIKEEDLI